MQLTLLLTGKNQEMDAILLIIGIVLRSLPNRH
jgi:hypothetical protein